MTKALPANAGVPGSLLQVPWAPRAGDCLGFYGCAGGGGQLVRVGLRGAEDRKPPRAVMVDCPACGTSHLVQPKWRRPEIADEGREPDLVLDLAYLTEDDEPQAAPEDGD